MAADSVDALLLFGVAVVCAWVALFFAFRAIAAWIDAQERHAGSPSRRRVRGERRERPPIPSAAPFPDSDTN
jgi:hypothetical protein